MTDIQTEINKLRAMIDELESQLKAPDPLWPQDGDIVWLYGSGVALDIKYKAKCNEGLLKSGLLFRTKEEAINAGERRIIETELRNCEGLIDVFDASNTDTYWYLVATKGKLGDSVHIEYWSSLVPSNVRFKDKASAQSALAKVGHDRVKFWLTGRRE